MSTTDSISLQQQIRSLLDQDLAEIRHLHTLAQEGKRDTGAQVSQELTTLQKQLDAEIKQRSMHLSQQIQKSSLLTRELMRIELEEERLQQGHHTTEQEISEKRQHLRQLQQEQEQQESDNKTLQNALQNTTHTIAQLQQQREVLESQLEQFRNEQDALEETVHKLQGQVGNLQGNLDRLKQMKEANMLSVMELTQRIRDVSTGKD